MAGSLTPTSWRRVRAGLISGPRKLKTVGTPSSLRTGPTKRMAGWKRWAKQNPMPASATQRATPSGPSSMATPSASSTSAVPTDDEAARLPCLHTGTPHPAAMNAASVVTLMLASRSPPVPTRSTATVGVPLRQRAGHGGVDHGPGQPGHLLGRLALGVQQGQEGAHLGRRGLARSTTSAASPRPRPRVERLPPAQAGQDLGPGQSHHRSRSSTPRAIRPSCTWEVPSTMVSCLASRYHCSVGWSSM